MDNNFDEKQKHQHCYITISEKHLLNFRNNKYLTNKQKKLFLLLDHLSRIKIMLSIQHFQAEQECKQLQSDLQSKK